MFVGLFRTTRVLLGGLVHKRVKWSRGRKHAAKLQRARIFNVEVCENYQI
jgi:hypothetical protein